MLDLTRWLEELGLGKYAATFAEHEIDVEILGQLSEKDLKDIGIPLGPRKKLLQAIAARARDRSDASAGQASASTLAPSAEAERRQLTVMFCDLVGSTALSTQMDPEDLREIIRRYQEVCTAIIQRYGGYISRYLGDGILIYFGYPRAQEHDPERSLRAGLEIVSAVAALQLKPDLDLQVRVGIATGEVVVGDLIGDGASQERAVVGETPNLAARLQGLAAPGSVFISDTTRRLVGQLFEYQDLGTQALKGFSKPIQIWRVVAERTVESRFEATRAAALAPLIGREQELALLVQCWDKARRGHGQVVLLSGEPGIGKSRLTAGLRERLAGETHTQVRYYGSPYHQSSALHPVISQLERAAGFTRNDSASVKLHKLAVLLARSSAHLPDELPLLASLLSVSTEGRYPPLALTPQRQKEQTLNALELQLVGLAAHQPVLLVFEDLHWVDPTTRQLLDRLMARVRELPVLLLMTHRPDFSPPSLEADHITRIALNRLDHTQNEALVTTLAGGKRLPRELLEPILARAEGIPLFVEELTKTVLQAGYLRDEGDHYALSGPLPPAVVPETLHDSLMARLDRLVSVKEVAQTGAVIGRHFSHDLLAAVSLLAGQALEHALKQLAEAELIEQHGVSPEITYTFNHALVRDAAYGSILRTKRRVLHERIAHALEEKFPRTVETEPELLAHHFEGAGLPEPAITYWHRAGQRAVRRSALAEALDHERRGLALIEGLREGSERDRRELELQNTLGPALLMTKGYAAPEVEQAFARALALAECLENTPDLFLALRGLWAFYFVRAEYPSARELSEQLLKLAEREGDSAYALEAHRAMGMTLQCMGDFAPALQHLERGSELYDPQRHGEHAFRYGNDPGMVCLIYGATALWFLGYPQRALDRLEDGLQLAHELNHPFTLTQALALATSLHQLRGEVQPTLERGEASLALAAKHGSFPYWTAIVGATRGWALGESGDVQSGLNEIRRARAAYEATGALVVRPWFLGRLAESCRSANELPEAFTLVDEACAEAQRTGEGLHQSDLERLRGDLTLQRGGPDAAGEAQAYFLRASERARAQGARSWELRAATSLARMWYEQGKREAARELLGPVYGAFDEGLGTVDLRNAACLLQALA